jgi:hypothetical protein
MPGNPPGSPHRSTKAARRHLIQTGWGFGRWTIARVTQAAAQAGVSPSSWAAAALLVALEQPAAVLARLTAPWACPVCGIGPAERASSTADVCRVCALALLAAPSPQPDAPEPARRAKAPRPA